MNLEKIYQYALKREQEGYDFFKANAEKTAHAAAAGVFEKLAEEELKHIEYIKGLMEGSEEAETSTVAELEDEGFFEDRARTELLAQSVIESMIPDVAVLRTAYLIEHDLAEFYEKAAAMSVGKAQEAFGLLAKWERGHEVLFRELHDRVFEEYTEMPWGG